MHFPHSILLENSTSINTVAPPLSSNKIRLEANTQSHWLASFNSITRIPECQGIPSCCQEPTLDTSFFSPRWSATPIPTTAPIPSTCSPFLAFSGWYVFSYPRKKHSLAGQPCWLLSHPPQYKCLNMSALPLNTGRSCAGILISYFSTAISTGLGTDWKDHVFHRHNIFLAR